MGKAMVSMMENESIKKVLIKFAIPAIASALITSIYNIVDALFIGVLDITAATAAISVAFPLFVIIGAIGLVFGVGGGTFVSRLLGAKKKDYADTVNSTVMFTMFFISILITIIGLIFIKSILRALGASETVMPYAVAYSKILIWGSFFTIGNMSFGAMVRSEGNVKYNMIIILIGTLLNIIFDPIFIFFLKLGLEGSAYATILAQVVSFTFFVDYYIGKKSYVKLSLKLFKPKIFIYKEILKVGIPAFIKQFLLCFSVAMINFFVSAYGDFAVAAMGITLRVTSMGLIVIFGFTGGFRPLVAYNYGAKRFDRLYETVKVSFIWLTEFSVLFAVLIFIFAEIIMTGFSNDINVINAGVILFRAYAYTFPFLGFIYLCNSSFEAIGMGKYAFILAISNQGIFFITCLILLEKFFAFNGIAFAQSASNVASLCFSGIMAFRLNKKIVFQSYLATDIIN